MNRQSTILPTSTTTEKTLKNVPFSTTSILSTTTTSTIISPSSTNNNTLAIILIAAGISLVLCIVVGVGLFYFLKKSDDTIVEPIQENDISMHSVNTSDVYDKITVVNPTDNYQIGDLNL